MTIECVLSILLLPCTFAVWCFTHFPTSFIDGMNFFCYSDECSHCDKEAICVNKHCICDKGFVGDGLECWRMLLFSTKFLIPILMKISWVNVLYNYVVSKSVNNLSMDDDIKLELHKKGQKN